MNTILKEDIYMLIQRHKGLFDQLAGNHVLVTGATGLIGSNLVAALATYNKEYAGNIGIYVFVRSESKAKRIFGEFENIHYVVGDITSTIELEDKIDYIVHAASMTSSKAFVGTPVDVIHTAIWGTENLLELARKQKIKCFMFLSTMEVYGAPQSEDKIPETCGTNINTMVARSCYPESKRLCESLCAAYSSQYGIPVRVLRLTQTFGPGVAYDDSRVFAEFIRCAINKQNIILHTTGMTKRNYLYTADAVSAILQLLTCDGASDAYNVANESTYCSIKEMAEMVCAIRPQDEIKVEIQIENNSSRGYAPQLMMNLDTSKIRELGWMPEYGMKEMLSRLFAAMKEECGAL